MDAGADSVIIYTSNDFEKEIERMTHGDGLKMVFDAVGRTTFNKGISCLRPRGYMVLYGQASGAVPELNTNTLRTGSKFLTRPSLGDYTSTREELLYRANEVIEWVSSGELRIRVGLTLKLSEAAEAHRQLEGRETTGKILLIP
jgi:NADPH2:quinone reductase